MIVDPKLSGSQAEYEVSEYLQQQGLQPVTHNYSCKAGEIDLIMRDQETLVFVEVRYRKLSGYGDGAESVTKSKQRKIIRAAKYYLLTHNLFDKVPCRFDVVAKSDNPAQPLQWIKDAFWMKY